MRATWPTRTSTRSRRRRCSCRCCLVRLYEPPTVCHRDNHTVYSQEGVLYSDSGATVRRCPTTRCRRLPECQRSGGHELPRCLTSRLRRILRTLRQMANLPDRVVSPHRNGLARCSPWRARVALPRSRSSGPGSCRRNIRDKATAASASFSACDGHRMSVRRPYAVGVGRPAVSCASGRGGGLRPHGHERRAGATKCGPTTSRSIIARTASGSNASPYRRSLPRRH
jgi:hypothetical protein